MQTNKENIIVTKTFEFAVNIVKFTDQLQLLKKYSLANQLFRSGTSIGANVREAQNAESKNDFIHKLKIAAKEADETEYWLNLCKETLEIQENENLLIGITSIHKLLSKIISTSKAQLSNCQIIKLKKDAEPKISSTLRQIINGYCY